MPDKENKQKPADSRAEFAIAAVRSRPENRQNGRLARRDPLCPILQAAKSGEARCRFCACSIKGNRHDFFALSDKNRLGVHPQKLDVERTQLCREQNLCCELIWSPISPSGQFTGSGDRAASRLRATAGLATVYAFVAGTVAHHDASACGTSWRIVERIHGLEIVE